MPRKQKTIHYLYKTTCKVTGRYYIGMHSTNNLADGYMGSGRRLRASIRKHGADKHVKEILEFFDSRELLIEAETKAITPNMVDDPNCMNLMGGGIGGFISDEQQRYRSQCGGKAHAERMKTDKEYRDKVIQIGKQNLSNYINSGKHNFNTFSGKTHTEETKKKISESKRGQGKGENNSQFGTCWVTNGKENRKIKKEELDIYTSQGWDKGRKLK
jgi:hypothetical protein